MGMFHRSDDATSDFAPVGSTHRQDHPRLYDHWKQAVCCKFSIIIITMGLLIGITIATGTAPISLACCMPDTCDRTHFGQVKSDKVIVEDDGSCFVNPQDIGSGGLGGAIGGAVGIDNCLRNTLNPFTVDAACSARCKDKKAVETKGTVFAAVLGVILGVIVLQCISCCCDFFLVRRNQDDAWNGRADEYPIYISLFFVLVGLVVTVVTLGMIGATTRGYVDTETVKCNGKEIKQLAAKSSDPVVGMAAVAGILAFVSIGAVVLALVLNKLGKRPVKGSRQSATEAGPVEYYSGAVYSPSAARDPYPSPIHFAPSHFQQPVVIAEPVAPMYVEPLPPVFQPARPAPVYYPTTF